MRRLLNVFSKGPRPSTPQAWGRPVPPAPRPAAALDPNFGDPVAAAVRSELERGSYAGARELMSCTRHHGDRAFYAERLSDWRGMPGWIASWLKREPNSGAAHLLAGRHAIFWAWQARGSGYASAVEDESWRLFFGRLNMADMLLKRAAELDPQDPTPWAFMLTSARGLQLDKDEGRARFNEVQERSPGHPAAHAAMLQFLCKKWFGSHEEMFEFARAAAGAAPPDSPLHTLIAEAHVERWIADEEAKVTPGTGYFAAAPVRQELLRAGNAYFHGPTFTPTIQSVGNRGYFAFCFWLAGERDAAAEQFQAIGGWVGQYPWCLAGDPVKMYTRAAGECGVEGARKAA